MTHLETSVHQLARGTPPHLPIPAAWARSRGLGTPEAFEPVARSYTLMAIAMMHVMAPSPIEPALLEAVSKEVRTALQTADDTPPQPAEIWSRISGLLAEQ